MLDKEIRKLVLDIQKHCSGYYFCYLLYPNTPSKCKYYTKYCSKLEYIPICYIPKELKQELKGILNE